MNAIVVIQDPRGEFLQLLGEEIPLLKACADGEYELHALFRVGEPDRDWSHRLGTPVHRLWSVPLD